MSRIWIGSSAPPTGDYRHLPPLRTTPLPAGFHEEFSNILETLGPEAPRLSRAALVSLLPWFSVWAHRCLEIAASLPDDEEQRRLPVTTCDTDALEDAVIRSWCHNRVTKVSSSPRAPKRRAPRLEQLASVLGTLASPIEIDRSDVLVISLQSNSTRSVLPVAKLLRESGRTVTFAHLAIDGTSADALAQERFPRIPLERLTPFRALASIRGALRFLDRTLRDPRLSALLSRLPLPPWLPPTTLAELFIRLARSRFVTAFLKGAAVSEAVDRINPRVLVFPSDHSLLARLETNATKILVLQGVVPPAPGFSQHLPVHRAIVGSSLDLEYTRASGIPPDTTDVVGYPEYAHFDEIDPTDSRRRLFQRLPSRKYDGVVLFTSQYPTELFPEWARYKNLSELIAFADSAPQTLVVIKPHPRREVFESTTARTLPSNVVLAPSGFTTSELMKAADVAVTYWSTTALEAFLLGVPLVQLNSTGLSDYYPIAARAGLPVARSAADLREHIEALLSSPSRRAEHLAAQQRYLELARIPSPRGAAERSAGVIESALAKTRKSP